jgi:hypothetical protein
MKLAAILLVLAYIATFIILKKIFKKFGDDEKTSPEIEDIMKEIKSLREDINRKEKALVDLLQELKK